MATTLAPPPARAAAVAEPPKQDRRLGRWAALAALLGVTAVLYLWDLTASGYANTFYAAAAQAGSKDWTAWFFGSLDPENFITVDKPPASLWVMGLSARIFGFSSAAILVPQALMGVASVATVYAAVRRVTANGWAAWLGGAVVAATPAAALMFRFDNPDALLVLLMALGAYFVVRAVEHPVGRRAAMWLALAGAALGFAFLTKCCRACWCSRRSRWRTSSRDGRGCGRGCCTSSVPVPRSWSAPVGGSSPRHCGRPNPVPTSAARPTTP